VPDLAWFAPDGGQLRWQDENARTLCYQLDSGVDGPRPEVDRLFFILNAHWEPQWVKLPALEPGRSWHRAIDTSLAGGEDFAESGEEVRIDPPDHYITNPRTTVVLISR